MIDWSTCSAVEKHPEPVSGAWVFRGTRVPVSALFENLEVGADVSEFVQWFPGVTVEQTRQFLEHAAKSTLASACMHVLFDQGVPVPLRDSLHDHDVETAHERGWSTLENGEPLQRAESEGFDVFVSTDQSFKYQQNLSDRSIAIIVLSTPSWPRIRQVLELVSEAVQTETPGSHIEVHIP